MNRSRDPPSPIDNRSIVINRPSTDGSSSGTTQTLRLSSDHMSISQDMWLLFHSIYGGGPEVVSRPNGTVTVTSTAGKPSLPALKSKLRSRTISEGMVGKSVQGAVTRSKAKSLCEQNVMEAPEIEKEENYDDIAD